MFETEFAKVEYIEESNIVLHTWKKACSYMDYRTPVMESVKLLEEHKESIFVVDARNGFEDEKEDVEWGFSYFLPKMKKTGCEKWMFIVCEVSDIEDELDLWTKEIMKYFEVIRVTSLENALKYTK